MSRDIHGPTEQMPAVQGIPVAQGEGGPALIVIYAPPGLLRRAYALTGTSITVGRIPESTICIPLNAISRTHFTITYEGGRWWIEDEGSLNHTYVDEVPLVGRMVLEHGKEIRAGFCSFKFVTSGIGSHLALPTTGDPGSNLPGGPLIRRVAAEVARVAPTHLTVLITGEDGTEKSAVADEVHRLGGRSGPLRVIDCAALDPELLENELPPAGLVAPGADARIQPSGVTIYLDELDELPATAQPSLRRFFERRAHCLRAQPESARWLPRIVASARDDAPAMVARGTLRPELVPHLRDSVVRLPPLRDRKEDIPLLVDAILRADPRPRSDAFMSALCAHPWRYNVWELESVVQRALAYAAPGQPLGLEHLADELRASTVPPPPATSGASTFGANGPSKVQLLNMLARHGNNISAVAAECGKSRWQVHRWMKKLRIARV